MNRAITASAAHATLEDLGYQTCKKHDEGPFRWSGRVDCPRCADRGNPNLIPRRHAPEPPLPARRRPRTKKARRESESRLKGANAGHQKKRRKLSDEQVKEVRERRKRGEQLTALAREFGLSTQAISNAVYGVDGYAEIPGALSNKKSNAPPEEERIKLPLLNGILQKRGISFAELSRQTKIPPPTLSGYAKNDRGASRENANAIRAALDVSLEELGVPTSKGREFVKLQGLQPLKEEAGVYYSVLAQQTNIPKKTIENWGRKDKGCPVEKIPILLKAFERLLKREVAMEELIGWEEEIG